MIYNKSNNQLKNCCLNPITTPQAHYWCHFDFGSNSFICCYLRLFSTHNPTSKKFNKQITQKFLSRGSIYFQTMNVNKILQLQLFEEMEEFLDAS